MIGFSIFSLVTGFLAMSLVIMQINSDDQAIALYYTMSKQKIDHLTWKIGHLATFKLTNELH